MTNKDNPCWNCKQFMMCKDLNSCQALKEYNDYLKNEVEEAFRRYKTY